MTHRDAETPNHKLQPVVLIIPTRLECDTCRALAVFVGMDIAEESNEVEKIFTYRAYCQDCWHNAVHEDDKED